MVVGKGAEAKAAKVSVRYVGTLTDGKEFDSSRKRNEPLRPSLGAREVIAGWDQGVAGTKVGGQRKLVIPPTLGCGARGAPADPPNATLNFEVELLGVNGEWTLPPSRRSRQRGSSRRRAAEPPAGGHRGRRRARVRAPHRRPDGGGAPDGAVGAHAAARRLTAHSDRRDVPDPDPDRTTADGATPARIEHAARARAVHGRHARAGLRRPDTRAALCSRTRC